MPLILFPLIGISFVAEGVEFEDSVLIFSSEAVDVEDEMVGKEVDREEFTT